MSFSDAFHPILRVWWGGSGGAVGEGGGGRRDRARDEVETGGGSEWRLTVAEGMPAPRRVAGFRLL